MEIYKIGKCDYCENKNQIVRSTPFMADLSASMCEYCWDSTQKEYENSTGEYIPDFQSHKEEYKMKKKAAYEVQLIALEKEFKRVGYTDKVIDEIKHIDGATEVEEFIANLEEELSSWSD